MAAFDADSKRVGRKCGGITIKSIDTMAKVVKDKKVSIGIIATPAESAQEVAEKLVKAKVECILNFAPTALAMPENVKVKDVDLSRELETLSYFLADK